MAALEMNPVIIAVVGGLLAWIALELGIRLLGYFQGKRILKQAIDRAIHPEKYANEPPRKLDPESRFVVRVSEMDVSCERPDGKLETVQWSDLQRVEILNTGDGPWLPDTFWVLHGALSGSVIPWGATGERNLLKRLQELPGFNSSAVIGGASCTSNESRLCWQRTT